MPHDKLNPEEGVVERRDGLISVQPGQPLHVVLIGRIRQDFLYAPEKDIMIHGEYIHDFPCSSHSDPEQIISLIENER